MNRIKSYLWEIGLCFWKFLGSVFTLLSVFVLFQMCLCPTGTAPFTRRSLTSSVSWSKFFCLFTAWQRRETGDHLSWAFLLFQSFRLCLQHFRFLGKRHIARWASSPRPPYRQPTLIDRHLFITPQLHKHHINSTYMLQPKVINTSPSLWYIIHGFVAHAWLRSRPNVPACGKVHK